MSMLGPHDTMPGSDVIIEPSPTSYALPEGRVGRWLFSLHTRYYAAWADTNFTPFRVTDLVDARTRKVEFKLNQPTEVSFTVAGDSPTAGEILELGHEVVAWRFDERTGRDVPMARAVVLTSQDTISPQVHTVHFTCGDALALLKRRFITRTYAVTQRDQDIIVSDFLARVQGQSSTEPEIVNALPGAQLNTGPKRVNPDGTTRANYSGRLRDRTYEGQTNAYEAIDNLSNVIDGFDYDISPYNAFRIYYPNQGVYNDAWTLEYGNTVMALTRSINSGRYANYVRTLGQQPSDPAPGALQVANSTWTAGVGNDPLGLWMQAESATDVSNPTTLLEKSTGTLRFMNARVPEGPASQLVPLPNYSIDLRPGAYYAGAVQLGDTVPLIIRRGRLRTSTLVRVVGITFNIGDDGQEDVSVEVGTPSQSFIGLLTSAARRVSALERRV